MDRNEVIRWMRMLSPAEFAELVYDAWADWPRSPSDYYESEHRPTGAARYALAEVGFYDGWATNIEPARCEAQFVARDADGRTPFAGAGTWESGSCPRCHADLVCWSKDARCPICGAECGLT